MPYYYGYDWTYVYLVLPCLIFSLWASWRVNSTFKKYSKQYSSRGLTGADAAQRVLRANGVSGVRIERIGGSLTDHYDPTSNVIRLSDDVYGSTSTAAIGVACHEAGHAVPGLCPHQAAGGHHSGDQFRLQDGHASDSIGHSLFFPGQCL